MPIDYKLYPPEFFEVRDELRNVERIDHCEWCGAGPHASRGARSSRDMRWFSEQAIRDMGPRRSRYFDEEPKLASVVLTTAHLDHNLANNERSNLRRLCQQCHLWWDAPEKAAKRKAKRERREEAS